MSFLTRKREAPVSGYLEPANSQGLDDMLELRSEGAGASVDFVVDNSNWRKFAWTGRKIRGLDDTFKSTLNDGTKTPIREATVNPGVGDGTRVVVTRPGLYAVMAHAAITIPIDLKGSSTQQLPHSTLAIAQRSSTGGALSLSGRDQAQRGVPSLGLATSLTNSVHSTIRTITPQDTIELYFSMFYSLGPSNAHPSLNLAQLKIFRIR